MIDQECCHFAASRMLPPTPAVVFAAIFCWRNELKDAELAAFTNCVFQCSSESDAFNVPLVRRLIEHQRYVFRECRSQKRNSVQSMIWLVFGAESWDDMYVVTDHGTQVFIKIIQLIHFLMDETFLARDKQNGWVIYN
jgi:hypothetical protein